MSVGMDDDDSTVSSMASCSCQHDAILPIYSVVDLDAFKHDPQVEECLDDLFDSSINEMPDLAEASLSSTSSSGGSVPDVRKLTPVRVPDFIDIVPEVRQLPTPPAVMQALHQFKVDLLSMDISAVDYYQYLQVSTVELSPTIPPRGHVDGGALATTTDRKNYLWAYHELSEEERSHVPRLRVADNTVHVPTGVGFLKVPCEKNGTTKFVRSYYTPEIPATILSPNAMGEEMGCQGYQTYSDFRKGFATLDLTDCKSESSPVHFELRLIRGLLFTDHLIAPTQAEHLSATLPDGTPSITDATDVSGIPCDGSCHTFRDVNALTREQQRSLWHMRLGHINERLVSDLHKYADGVPSLPRADVLHSCPMCARAKLHKANRGDEDTTAATECWQDIQIDFGFFVQRSSGRQSTSAKKKKQRRPKSSATRNVRSIQDIRPLTRAQRLKLHKQYTSPPIADAGDTSDTSATSTTTLGTTPKVTTVPDDDSSIGTLPAPSSVPLPETVTTDTEDENSSADISPRSKSATQSFTAPSQRYTFERIVAHEGPLRPGRKRYLGSPFNVKVLWSTGTTTWEPLDRFFHDAPEDVADYARQHNLLSNRHWRAVREYIMNPPPPTTVADLDDETELVDGTTLDPDSTIVEPMDATTSAAKAANATKRYRRLVGINGETCYVLITDRKSGAWRVSIRRDKTPPLDFFKEWLATHGSSAPNRRVRFDGGGELGGCTEVHDLFRKAGYDVEVTAPNSSSEIGQAERPHRTIADGVRTMLFAANLKPKYWPYALRQFVLISNCVPHGNRTQSAIELCTGQRPNLSLLRVFGCRVYALPTESRDAKIDVHARPGIFLGYKKSMRHAYYEDLETGKIKTARHIAFDEGMNDLKTPPPYVRFLKGELEPHTVHLDDATRDMQVSLSPFTDVDVVDCDFRPSTTQPLGFQVESCPRFKRAYASAFNRPFGPHETGSANRRYLGGYILKVGQHFTFSPDDVQAAIASYSRLASPPKSLPVVIARDFRAHLSDSRPPSLHLRPVDLRRAAALPLVAGEGHSVRQREALRAYANAPSTGATPPDPDDHIEEGAPVRNWKDLRKLVNDHMTEEEKALPSFTRKNLQTLPNWAEWQAADDKQLDSHFDAGTIGMAVPRPVSSPDKPSQVFRLVWARLVKASGVRKSRACLDGSKRAAPWLRMLVQTYSSCIELPCLRAFIAMCVNRGYYIAFGDVENAYQQSPPPSIACFLEVDDTVYDWYLRKFGIKLNKHKDVIPLFRALQGHPEAGVLWERLITEILIDRMGFRNTVHERNIYSGTIDGKDVLVCRQVDDFAVGAESPDTAELFITKIREHVQAEYAAMGIETEGGLYQRYNGIDVFQTRDYVKLSCESYIDRMLQTHGWDAPASNERDCSTPVPIQPSVASHLMTLEGPPEKTPEAKAIVAKKGFSYRNVLGELIFAYVICRLDIGYSVCLLARFSERPHEEHFDALKGICKYLRRTKSWGIMFRRLSPLDGLPDVPFEFLEDDPNLPAFPFIHHDELIGCLDAAHATDLKTRRSVTGLVVLFCCAAIAWKSRVQAVVATSSTEAEFYASVSCAKIVKYLRYVLTALDALRPGPTRLFIDNMAALHMINEKRPTPRARHIDIQHFAIQEWCDRKDIIMEHLPGILNPSDDLTKPLGWVLHARHVRRNMGHYKIGSPTKASVVAHSSLARMGTNEAGEGDGARSMGDRQSRVGHDSGSVKELPGSN